MDKRFFPDVMFDLSLDAGRCRYIMWFNDNVWEDKLKYFITLLEGSNLSELEKEAVTSATPGAWNATYGKKPTSQLNEEAYLAIPPNYDHKAWSDEARRAALEARRRKARQKPEEPKGRTKKPVPQDLKTPKESEAEPRETRRRHIASMLSVETSIASSIYPDSPSLQRDLETAIKRRVGILLEKIPKEHTRLVKAVNVKRKLEAGTYKGEPAIPLGVAHFKESSIDLNYAIIQNKEITSGVVNHEVGHLVQDAMDGTNQQYWRNYYHYMRPTMSCDYGKTNDLEGFATNYERMIDPKRHNPDDLNEQVVRLYSGQRLKISRDEFKSMIDDQGGKQDLPDDIVVELLHQYDKLMGLETP